LVLAGGKSLRMGYDKSLINWHGKEQQYYMADLLTNVCSEVFISRRDEQKEETITDYKIIRDSFTGLGPYGAILSAFREQPDAAWLVAACDLPLLNKATLQFLEENRNASSIATAFQSPHDNLPEPLITIWEPRSYPALLNFLSQGFTCPRKFLINNNNVTLLHAPEPDALKNVNTPEDVQEVKKIIREKIMMQNES
jgi:molybdopterin-guanine dinucleotide biosynthesis protein A